MQITRRNVLATLAAIPFFGISKPKKTCDLFGDSYKLSSDSYCIGSKSYDYYYTAKSYDDYYNNINSKRDILNNNQKIIHENVIANFSYSRVISRKYSDSNFIRCSLSNPKYRFLCVNWLAISKCIVREFYFDDFDVEVINDWDYFFRIYFDIASWYDNKYNYPESSHVAEHISKMMKNIDSKIVGFAPGVLYYKAK